MVDPYTPLFDEGADAPFDPANPFANTPPPPRPRVLQKTLGPRAPAQPPGPPPANADDVAKYRQLAESLVQQAGGGPNPEEIASMREYARKRQEQAQRDFERGMVMSVMGGSAFQPIGAQVLKQALAAQQPEKVGGGIVQGGEFIVDPEQASQNRAKRLEAQAKIYESMAANAATLAQKTWAEQQAAQTRQLIAAMSAGSRQSQQDQTQANRTFQQENALRDDFEKQVKDQRISISTYPQIEAALTGTPTAASDMRAIFRYMKMLDPTSVVREGEYATARNAAGVPAQIANLYNKVLTGVSLTPAQRSDFLKQARSERDTALKYFNERAAEFHGRARTYGLNPQNVVLGYGDPQAQAAPGGRGTRVAPIKVAPRAPQGASPDDAIPVDF